jgi:CDP-glycerol glycerophosphotransferase
MAEPPLISVIIPVHRVADYLPECLDSVLGQPAPPIEVIAVDDDSPDDSGQILDDRAEKDPRLRVVHLDRNHGQGYARDTGLELASGEYVWFVDGDDTLADGALAAIGARLASGRPDVLLIDWLSSYPGGRTAPSRGARLLAGVPPGGCTLADQPRLLDLTMTVWSKLLRREFLTGLGQSFPEGIHEDVPITCAALLGAETIEALDRICYRYRQRAGSAMATTTYRHYRILESYGLAFRLLYQTPVSDAVDTALFERAIWHYTTVLDARAPVAWPGERRRERLVPRDERRQFFDYISGDFQGRRPVDYRFPPGARGIKFRLVEARNYPAYALLSQLNRLRVAVTSRLGA